MSYLLGDTELTADQADSLADEMLAKMREEGLIGEPTPSPDAPADATSADAASDPTAPPEGEDVAAGGASEEGKPPEESAAPPAAPPVADTTTPAAPTAPAPDEPSVVIVDDGDGSSSPTAAPSSTSSPDGSSPDDVDLNELFTRYMDGNKPSPEYLVSLLTLADQVGGLDPARYQQLQAFLAGQPLAPQTPGSVQSVAPAPTAPAPATPTPATLDIDAVLRDNNIPPEAHDTMRGILAPLAERIDALSQQQQQQQVAVEQQRIAEQQAYLSNQIQSATQSFVSEYGSALSPADLVLIEQRAARSGQLATYISMHGGDVERGHAALLYAAMMSDPAMVTKLAAAQSDTQTADQQAAEQRRTLASAVSATGTAQPTAPAPAATPRAPAKSKAEQQQRLAEAQAAAVAAIEQAGGLPEI